MSRLHPTGYAHIGTVLKTILEQTAQASGGMTSVWDVWEEAVGSAIAAHARPAAFQGRLLVVHVTGPAWIQELRYHKADIIERLNRCLGSAVVGDIRFRTGMAR